MKFHLIRHGRTEANEKKLYYGFSDIGLSSKGRKELLQLKKEIKYPVGNLFINSGMKRTIETMKILYQDTDFLINKNLKEINFGDFELKSYEELKENKDYIKWIENIEKNEIPNGETKNQFETRVIIGFLEIFEYSLRNRISDIIIICHSGVISTFMQSIFKNEKNFYEWLPEYGRGYSVIFDKSNNIYYNKI